MPEAKVDSDRQFTATLQGCKHTTRLPFNIPSPGRTVVFRQVRHASGELEGVLSHAVVHCGSRMLADAVSSIATDAYTNAVTSALRFKASTEKRNEKIFVQ